MKLDTKSHNTAPYSLVCIYKADRETHCTFLPFLAGLPEQYTMDMTPPKALGLSTNSPEVDSPITPFVSYYVYSIFNFVLGVSMTSAVAMFGVFSNITNTVVFYKLGLGESINISFFSLAINDLIMSITTVVVEVTLNPAMRIRLPAGDLTLQSGFVASLFVYTCCGLGAWITALLSTEKCLCILFPLKVSNEHVGEIVFILVKDFNE